MTEIKRIVFAGYAPVHFLCFRPVYDVLRRHAHLDVWLSGGFRRPGDGPDEVRYDVQGFYDPYGVDMDRVASFEEVQDEEFDVLVCGHSSKVFFPRVARRTVQIFHGVSFKNFAVREKALEYDVLCLPGRYHAERFESRGLVGPGSSRFLLTGFPKVDPLADGSIDRDARLRELGLDPSRPTVLYAPTGGKHNSLDTDGERIVADIARDGRWNLLVKPHDHPKKDLDWFEILAPLENERVKLVRDFDVVPLLASADLLLTDASSVAMEYTLLDRPMVFVDVPKLLANVEKRGGALDLDTYGRRIGTVTDAGDVVEAIASGLANPGREGELRRQAAAHLFHEAGHATANVAAVVREAAGLAGDLPTSVHPLTPWRSSA